MESLIIYMPIVMAIIGLLFMVVKKSWVLKQDAGDGKMKEISDHIYEGALAFLKAEYRLLTLFVIGVSVLLFIVSTVVPSTHWLIVIAFVVGAFFSALAGNMGMKIATKQMFEPLKRQELLFQTHLKYLLAVVPLWDLGLLV